MRCCSAQGCRRTALYDQVSADRTGRHLQRETCCYRRFGFAVLLQRVLQRGRRPPLLPALRELPDAPVQLSDLQRSRIKPGKRMGWVRRAVRNGQ